MESQGRKYKLSSIISLSHIIIINRLGIIKQSIDYYNKKEWKIAE